MGRQQLLHALEEGILAGGILEAQVQFQLIPVQFFFEFGVGQKTFDLTAEQQGITILIIIEGLDAEVIPGAEQGVGLFIPQRKGKHTPKPLQQALAPLFVAVQQHLRVAAGGKHMAFFFQLGFQLLKIVDLAVEDHHHAAVFVVHGLCTALQVDDGQAAMTQGHTVIQVAALPVRAAVRNAVHHFLQHGLLVIVRLFAGKTNDSTHNFFPSPAAAAAGRLCTHPPCALKSA